MANNQDNHNKNEENNQAPTPIEESPIEVEELPEEIESPEITEEVEPVSQVEEPIFVEEGKGKYVLIIVLFLVIFFGLFFLLFKIFLGGRGKSSTQITLVYWGLWEDKEIFEPLIKEFEKQNPNIKIDYQLKDARDQYREKLLARSPRNKGPDIFRYHNTWIPEIKDVLSYAPENIFPTKEFKEIYPQSIQQNLMIDNKIYGVSLMLDGLLLFYNEEILQAAGVQTPPTTWDELLTVIEKTTVKDNQGKIVTAGIAIGTANNIQHFSEIFLLMLYQNGDTLENLNSESAIEMLRQYRRFAEPPDNIWSEDMPDSVTAFAQGKVAMIFAPSWQYLIIKQINPEIKVKAVPVPQVPGSDPISIASYWVEGVSRYSENQPAAWKFLHFLAQKEQLSKMHELQTKQRSLATAYPRKDMFNLLEDHPILSAITKQADYFITTYGVMRTYDNGLNDEIVKYLENAINAAAQGVSYRDAMETAHQGVQQVLTKYNIITQQ